ncbi:MAG: hypothetical protein L0228_12885 [Planctomycetes bacterium]|nr:hypothetical protein [Planctomycetota bacterium]
MNCVQITGRLLALTTAFGIVSNSSLLAYDTIGNGFGSKWGADPNAGNGAVVTWSYMLDGTPLDPTGFPFHTAITGTSNITALRNAVDSNYGAGAFDSAIQNAFNTWSAVANITFVGPLTDSGMPVAGVGATSLQIRIGAFQAVPGQWFEFGSAIGIGPPGPFFDDPFSGDVIFNVDGIGVQRPYQIAPGQEDVDSVDVYNFGDDVEGVFVHELGHAAIGLNHPRWAGEDPDQRMMYVGDFDNPEAPYCCQSINRELHVDDIAAAQYVYGIRGDYNRDRRVDTADYVLWRKTSGQSVTSGAGADGNVDGIINAADFDLWHSHFGEAALLGFGEQPSFGAGSGVPEPSTLLLCVGLAAALGGTRVTRRN